MWRHDQAEQANGDRWQSHADDPLDEAGGDKGEGDESGEGDGINHGFLARELTVKVVSATCEFEKVAMDGKTR